MKIHGNFVVRLETVRNSYRGVRIAEVRLYCNSVLVDFFSFFFLYLFLGIGQTQSIDNIFKEFFPFFSSHGNLCTTMSESWLVELMQSVGFVHECLNAFLYISNGLNETQEDTSFVSQPGVEQSILLESGLARSIVSRVIRTLHFASCIVAGKKQCVNIIKKKIT